ncbi:trypsin-like protease-like protein 1 [Microdochium trichocladiopsis]|uniref:Trypsin-like protease-like protein 1 n=1 Tax=Microdochium trichocladiopsis TaxID=1682393 RepID=A0A9P9BR86_9PEZI|nr:trypsin-like protease-like protein 1 [Microdochium trichocladiopsis]KAH7032621.1 trypsin-like protease-like protein 1 [Microdochium trichocladiopsis]
MLPLAKLAVILAVIPALVSAAPTTPSDVLEARDEVDDGASSIYIVGGEAASAGDFPFMVSLSGFGYDYHMCGGVLLNANTVVTAGHCSISQTPVQVSVRAGSLKHNSGGVKVNVSEILVHPKYSDSWANNDIALWRLSTPIRTSSTIGYVTLPAQDSDPAAGSLAIVAGWGFTIEGGYNTPDALRKVTVPIVGRATCQAAYKLDTITTSMVCAGLAAGGKDACQGDSGGPLVNTSKTLIGLVSWGDGCARPNAYGVYTRVGQFVTWINANKW